MDDIDLGRCVGKGGNSEVFEIKNNPYDVVLLVGSVRGASDLKATFERYQNTCELHQKVPAYVRFSRISRVGYKNGHVALVMARAPSGAMPVHEISESYSDWSRKISVLAMAPQLHFDLLVSFVKDLNKVGLMIDPSKPNNALYSQYSGFFLVDIEAGNFMASVADIVLYPFVFFKSMNQLTANDFRNVNSILGKLIISKDTRYANINSKNVDFYRNYLKFYFEYLGDLSSRISAGEYNTEIVDIKNLLHDILLREHYNVDAVNSIFENLNTLHSVRRR